MGAAFFPVVFPSACFLFALFINFFFTVILGRGDVTNWRIQPDVEVLHFAAFFFAVGNFKTKVRSVPGDAPVFQSFVQPFFQPILDF